MKATLEKWADFRAGMKALDYIRVTRTEEERAFTECYDALQEAAAEVERLWEEYQRLLYWALQESLHGASVPWNGHFEFDHEQGLAWFVRSEASGPKAA
jgi:hypothetical protein